MFEGLFKKKLKTENIDVTKKGPEPEKQLPILEFKGEFRAVWVGSENAATGYIIKDLEKNYPDISFDHSKLHLIIESDTGTVRTGKARGGWETWNRSTIFTVEYNGQRVERSKVTYTEGVSDQTGVPTAAWHVGG